MRNKYIRFFISSTFADMAKERNILQKIFDRLSEEYAKKEWQIESVDLRWGISQEAGFDNKTMQICKSEIRRCQQLSPRPNFIVLLGNRYGWTPLPETIPHNIGKLLKMSKAEKDLFNRWYRLDENALPSGEYVLQERREQYRDSVIWFDEVEYPLGQMFKENAESFRWKIWKLANRSEHDITRLFGESATAQEINIGALSVPDAKDHVIAYIRDLANVPNPQKDIFLEQGERTIQKLEDLKDDLRKKLQKANVLDIETSYDQYSTEQFDIGFEREIEKKIRRVIENAIAEYESTEATTEDDIHLNIAAEEAKDFVGRVKVLNDIHQYIIDSNEHRPLWIKGPSGSGKSALLAKVIEQHRDTHHVVCRFCGRTAKALFPTDLGVLYRCFPSDFEKRFNKHDKPYLIVIDALNQLDDRNNLRFARLEWLRYDKFRNMKVIVSTTDELKYSQKPSFLKIYLLPNMGTDSVPLVTSILNKAGRTLTKSQYASLESVIDASDNSAIYLHILGHYLKTKTSWEIIEDNCSDIVYLIDNYLKHLTLPERHGQELVGEALALLTAERVGLSDKEMLDLLSRNKYVRKAVEANSFHQIEARGGEWRLPSVLWSRLRYDLSPFLRTYASSAGQVTTIFHDELKTIFTAIYLNGPAQKGDIASQLFHYYKEHIHQGDKHALLEIIHSAIVKGATENEMPLIREAIDFLSSELDFLLTKRRLFPLQLYFDFDEVLPFVDGEMRKEIASLKLSLSSLPEKANREQMLLYMYSLPSNTLLYRLAKNRVDSKTAMKNIISDSEPEDPTLYVLNGVGEIPCMSDDGKRVASLLENRHIIQIMDVTNPYNPIVLESEDEVMELQCDDEMKYLCIRLETQCQIFNIMQKTFVFWKNIGNHGWVSLSADGETFACGDVTTEHVYKMSKEDNLFHEFFSSKSSEDSMTMAGRLSPSGETLWLLMNNKNLDRIDLKLGKSSSVPIEFRELSGNLFDPWTCIPTCSDTRFVCFHQHYAVVGTLNDNKWCYWGKRHFWFAEELKHAPIIKISQDDQYLLYCTDGGCSIEKLNNGSADDLEFVNFALIESIVPNSNFSIALDEVGKKIVNLPLQLERYGFCDGDPMGINSLTSSFDGTELAVGFGKINTREKKMDVLRLSNDKRAMWRPSFKNKRYDLVRHVRISPDKSYIAATNIHNYNWKAPDELILCNIDNSLISSYDSDGDLSFTSLDFSKDSHYIISSISEEYRKGLPELCVVDCKNRGLHCYELPSDLNLSVDIVRLSDNNRYAIIIRSTNDEKEGNIGEGFYSLYDMISEKIVTINGEYSFPLGNYYAVYSIYIPLFIILPVPGQLILTNDVKRGLAFHLNVERESVGVLSMEEYRELTTSSTGRFLYIVNKRHQLFISWMFKGDSNATGGLIMEHIQWVIPALDEAHIYAVTDDFEILLYNIMSRKIEQRAYRGPFFNFQVCARGLFIINDKGDVALFQPDTQYNVNIPAVTTFVRRWNLNTKQQEEPTTVCPMCGHVFGLNEELRDLLKEGQDMNIFEYISHCDWDNPQLKSHSCPHCGAQLQFNPYII